MFNSLTNQFKVSLLFLSLTFLAGCTGGERSTTSLQPNEKQAVSKIIKSPAPPGKSFEGTWAYTVLQKNRNLLSGNKIFKVSPNQKELGEVVKPELIAPDEVVYIGYIKLNKNDGFEVLTNNFNSIDRFQDLKTNGNNLTWNTNYKLKPSSKDDDIDDNAVIKRTSASYNAIEDSLSGTTSTSYLLHPFKTVKEGRVMKVLGPDKIEPIFDKTKKQKEVAAATYSWKAIRISESDFEALAKTGEINTTCLPQYKIGLSMLDKRVVKELE